MYVDFGSLTGETVDEAFKGGEGDVIIRTAEGDEWRLYHEQDCCESVALEDVAGGELSDLNGEKILSAVEASKEDANASDSGTWTFYIIRTQKVTLTLRWYGMSNGYYSEEVAVSKNGSRFTD